MQIKIVYSFPQIAHRLLLNSALKHKEVLTAFLCFTLAFAQAQTGMVAAPQTLYDNAVRNTTGVVRNITIRNTSTNAVTINSVALAGNNTTEFRLSNTPALPHTVAPNDSLVIGVAFTPTSTGLKTASLNFTSSGAIILSVPLRGLGTAGTGGNNEPSLQALLQLYELQVGAGDDNPATNIINSNSSYQRAALLGEELSMQRFMKAGPGVVTIEPLTVFGPTDSTPVVAAGWYPSGNAASRQQLISVSNTPRSNAQTVQVAYTGTTTFDPGGDAFGFYSQWPFFQNRILYSEDSLNTFTGAIPHHVRVYPYRKGGVQQANTYIIAFEEHISGFDYQDLVFVARNIRPAGNAITIAIQPGGDAFIQSGAASTNYGLDTVLKVSTAANDTGKVLLQFPLQAATNVERAVLRLYGRNTTGNNAATLQVKGLQTATWSERTVTFNNAPGALDSILGTVTVGTMAQYYELDVTSFVQARFAAGQYAGFILSDTAAQGQGLVFNSKENGLNAPQLIITTSAAAQPHIAKLFVENGDRFPAADRFVTSRIQVPWSRDGVVFNSNHDTARIRLHNKGMAPLVIKGLTLTNNRNWRYLSLAGAAFDTTIFPTSINPGAYQDLIMQFVHSDPATATEIKLFTDTVVIASNDEATPLKPLYLHGLWQRRGESTREPDAQQTIDAFGFRTSTGFSGSDPDRGNASRPKGDEVLSSFFVRADATLPVTVRQMSAYHGCCTDTEAFRWYIKGNTASLRGVFTHIGLDGQSLLPRRSVTGNPAEGTFTSDSAFGLRIGSRDWSDTLLNPQRRIGLRVWKAIDAEGNVIPNSYIMANDYLGTNVTNYDYNDNMYFVTNIRPEDGPVYHALLQPKPSAIDFGEHVTKADTTYVLKLQSSGKLYNTGKSDPAITISSLLIVGENKSEFSASMPAQTTLQPQDSTTLNVTFKPASEGLKIADLLVYYNNSQSPLRVPLYGIGKDSGTVVNVHYRIKSGSGSAIVSNGKTWERETPYAFDNLEPYRNSAVSTISATDDDSLYVVEQSSDGDRKPFRYQLPLNSGNYALRLHFSEVYWGAPGTGRTGGAGSRVMNVTMENELKIANLDIVQESGVASALVRQVPVTVNDGQLNITFGASINRPSLSALEVYSFTRAVLPPPDTTTAPPTDTTTTPPTDTVIVTPPVDTLTPPEPLAPMLLYPNPNPAQFTLEFPMPSAQVVTFRITDIAGRRYWEEKYTATAGNNRKTFDLRSLRLKPGTYLLELLYQERERDVIKVVIQ